ncbi:MAG: lipopolysaccharide kinase InaA family protein [Phycisphaerae bacterium]
MTVPATIPSAPVNGALLVAPRFADLFRNAGLSTLDDLFDPKLGMSLGKPGLEPWRERIRFSPRGAEDAPVFYAKRFQMPPARARREIARSRSQARSCAGVEWCWINRLQAEGIPCAEPAAFAEEFRCGRELRSVVVTREVPGTSLETWCDARSAGEGEPGKLRGDVRAACDDISKRACVRKIAHQVARVITRLHEAGLFHRDLYLCHIFHDASAALDQSIRLIDLQRVIAPTWGHARWRIKDIAALNYSAPQRLFSNSDRLRWLKQYLCVSRLDAEARRMIYRIVGKTSAMAEHDRRRRVQLNGPGGPK